MAQKATERIAWAVETLAVAPDDHLLEIGCGHGVAVSLVCEQLTNGTITAIDRSQTMVDMAQTRNQACVAAGKANFRCMALEDADLGNQRFDKIFAIRVNFFIQQPARQLAKIKELLAPTGRFYFFYDPPAATQTAPFVATARQSLCAHGFSIEEVIGKALKQAQAVCIVAIVAD